MTSSIVCKEHATIKSLKIIMNIGYKKLSQEYFQNKDRVHEIR